MTTAGNLSKETLEEEIIALGMEFPESSLKFFLYYFLGRFVLQFYRKICFIFLFRISCHSNICEKFDLYFIDFRKAIA